MSVKLKIVAIFMISSSILFSFPSKAHNKPLDRNQISFEDQEPAQNQPQYGGTLVWGTTNSPTIINPVLTQHSVSAALIPLIFNGLVRINANREIEPDLAQSWNISEDEMVYTFFLKQGVLFHDGTECTAQDVKFTYDKIINPEVNSVYRSHFDLVDSFEVIDRYTFQITLKKPFVPLLTKLVRYIIPKHILVKENLHHNAFNYHPIGTGPFKFQKWDRGTNQIDLEANPNYFEGKPYLDNIIVKVYANNSELWSALMRHEVDFVKYLNYEDYKILKKDPVFTALTIPWKMYCAIIYNPHDSVLFDKEIRKAIAHGINTERLIKDVSGSGIRSTGPFHPESMGFSNHIQALEYNPIKARMILMHRGWQDKDKDGILEKGGRKLELRLLIDNRSDYYKKMATLIRQQLSEIGIKVTLLRYEDETQLTQEYLAQHNPQGWLRFFQGLGNDADEAIGSWYSLSNQFGKLWNYENKEIDRLFELGRITKNLNERMQIYQKIHKIIYEDQLACFLYFPVSFHAVSVKLKNTEAFFNSHMPGYSFKDWYIDERYSFDVSVTAQSHNE